MNNYKIRIEYNGRNFSGSQVQNGGYGQRTVQGELEKTLEILLREKDIQTIFSSRTDAGVHALGQIANFKSGVEIADLEINPDKTLISLNGILPEDISVTAIKKVDLAFHARHHAKSREYLYKIFNRRHRPVLRLDSLIWEKEPLDFELMKQHAEKFIGTHNFMKYCKSETFNLDEKIGCIENDYICTIFESELIMESPICIKYHIKANRFLRQMVRRIVGEIIEVGKGKTLQESSSYVAPAEGLTLIKVNY